MKAFHFLRDTRHLRSMAEAPPVGEWLEVEGRIEICERGLHGSRNMLDAMYYAPGLHLTYCEFEDIVDYQDDKLVARRRKILKERSIKNDLLNFLQDELKKREYLEEHSDKSNHDLLKMAGGMIRSDSNHRLVKENRLIFSLIYLRESQSYGDITTRLRNSLECLIMADACAMKLRQKKGQGIDDMSYLSRMKTITEIKLLKAIGWDPINPERDFGS